MAQFDFSHYRDAYGGELSEAEFMKYAPAAQDVVCVLAGDTAPESSPAVLRALCVQTDYTARCDASVERESVGDYSVSYGKQCQYTVRGIPVSPLALASLEAAGLLMRWC